MLVSVTVILLQTCEQSLTESPLFSPLVIIQLNFSRGSAGRSLRGGRVLCCPANGTTNLFQGTQSTSFFSSLKPDSINSEQTSPRQHDYKIPVPLRSHLSIYLTSFFFLSQLDLAQHLSDVGWNPSFYLQALFLAP